MTPLLARRPTFTVPSRRVRAIGAHGAGDVNAVAVECVICDSAARSRPTLDPRASAVGQRTCQARSQAKIECLESCGQAVWPLCGHRHYLRRHIDVFAYDNATQHEGAEEDAVHAPVRIAEEVDSGKAGGEGIQRGHSGVTTPARRCRRRRLDRLTVRFGMYSVCARLPRSSRSARLTHR